MFKKKMKLFRVVYDFDGEIYTQIGTGSGIASLDADPFVTILSVVAL